MEDLIFALPTFILFFFIMLKIFSLLRKGFDLVRKNFDLTIDQAGEKIRSSSKIDNDFDQDELENRIAEAGQESIAESKERILNQREKNENRKRDSKYQKQKKINKNKSGQVKKSSSLDEIFSEYDEVEKAVIYNEILSKPKALKED
ncbi:MAG: hypothetical protein ABR547_08445 [Halanaerobium sp.]